MAKEFALLIKVTVYVDSPTFFTLLTLKEYSEKEGIFYMVNFFIQLLYTCVETGLCKVFT